MSRRLLILVSAFAAAGCARYTAEPLQPAHRAEVLTSRRLGGGNWTVASLTTQAVKNSADVALARAQYRTSRAAIGTAGERPNPTVAISPQVVTPYTNWIAGTYGVDFDWTFETAGKRSRRVDVAIQNANTAAANVVMAEWKVRAAVRGAMVRLYGAERRIALLNDASTRQSEVLRMMTERVQAGAISSVEVAQPRLLAAQLRLQISEASKAAALARVALAEALSMSGKGLDGASFSFAEFERMPTRTNSTKRAALTHRADVLAALSDYAAAESALRLEIARQYPDIHLNPGYQLDAGENKWTLGIGLTLPILNQNKGAIREAEAKRREAAAKFDVVQAKVLADCERASAEVQAARAKLKVVDELLGEQQKQIESLQRIAAVGEGDKLAIYSAEVERATTRISHLDAMVDLYTALAALEEATQTPLGR